MQVTNEGSVRVDLVGETESYEARCRGHYLYDETEEQGLLPLEQEIQPFSTQFSI